MNKVIELNISQIDTKFLLKILERDRWGEIDNEYYSNCLNTKRYYCYNYNDVGDSSGIWLSQKEIREELKKRPHIPNKKESKNLRKERIRRGK